MSVKYEMMTSHRRHRKETIMSYSFKDKKQLFHGKEKSDGKGTQKVPLPLSQKIVYIDVKNAKQAGVMEDQLNKLGAVVEKFLSREVNYVISSSAPPSKTEERNNNVDNPQSPSFANVPSPFSSIPSPTGPSEPKTTVVPRGKTIAQIACARNRASTIVANAEKWGIKVISLEVAIKWLEKEIKKIEKEHGKDVTKKENEVQNPKKKVVVRRKRKVLKGAYIKFEAVNRMYRPIKAELGKWPKLNLLAPPGLNAYSEVKMKVNKVLRRHGSLRHGKASFSTSSGRSNLRKTHSMSSVKESISTMTTPQVTTDVVAVPITTTGDVKRHLDLLHKKRPDKLQGYCECCRVKYKDMNKHVKEEDHQNFARDKTNYEGLDALIKEVPSTSQFLQDILLQHCAKKQSGATPLKNSISVRQMSTPLNVDIQPVISPFPSEDTSPPVLEMITPLTPKRSRVKCSLADSKDKNPDEMDSRPHAVVIRRPTSSGVFVSPRRREPTPSKKPWMQERSMVFGQSPMASLQPSTSGGGIQFTVGENLLSKSFLTSTTISTPNNWDHPNKKSIVRSLVHLPDFASPPDKSNEHKISKLGEKKDQEILKVQESCTEGSCKVSDTKLAKCENKEHTDNPTYITEFNKDVQENVERLREQLIKTKSSPDFFVPCIADRVKRRTRVLNDVTYNEAHIESDSTLITHKEERVTGSCEQDCSLPLEGNNCDLVQTVVKDTKQISSISLDNVDIYLDPVSYRETAKVSNLNDTKDSVSSKIHVSHEDKVVNANQDEMPSLQNMKSIDSDCNSLMKDSGCIESVMPQAKTPEQSDVKCEKYTRRKSTRKESLKRKESAESKVEVIEVEDEEYVSETDCVEITHLKTSPGPVSGSQSSLALVNSIHRVPENGTDDLNKVADQNSDCILLSDASNAKCEVDLKSDNQLAQIEAKKDVNYCGLMNSTKDETVELPDVLQQLTTDDLKDPVSLKVSENACEDINQSSKLKVDKQKNLKEQKSKDKWEETVVSSRVVDEVVELHLRINKPRSNSFCDSSQSAKARSGKRRAVRRKSVGATGNNECNKIAGHSLRYSRSAVNSNRKENEAKNETLNSTRGSAIPDQRVRARVRKCRLFVHEAMYAQDGEEMNYSKREVSMKSKYDFKKNEESAEDAETNLDVNNIDNVKNKCDSLIHGGKRIFRGKKFHTTNANWDVDSQDNEDDKKKSVSETGVEDEPVIPNVAERVKMRRLCTLFNHEGKYANDGEGELSKSEETAYEIHNSKTTQFASESGPSMGPALVVRRIPTTPAAMTKKDTTWCKLMSRKDWSQSGSELNSCVSETEEVDSNISVNDNVKSMTKHQHTRNVCHKSDSQPLSNKMTHITHVYSPLKERNVSRTAKSPTTVQEINISELEEFKSPVKGGHRKKKKEKISHHECKLVYNEVSKNIKCNEKSISDGVLSNREAITNSPRIRIKIKKDLNDCYSSTIDELEEEYSVCSRNIESESACNKVEFNKEFGSPSSHIERSDTLDLLLTPNRDKEHLDNKPDISCDRHLYFSPMRHNKRDCHKKTKDKFGVSDSDSKKCSHKKRKRSDDGHIETWRTPSKEYKSSSKRHKHESQLIPLKSDRKDKEHTHLVKRRKIKNNVKEKSHRHEKKEDQKANKHAEDVFSPVPVIKRCSFDTNQDCESSSELKRTKQLDNDKVLKQVDSKKRMRESADVVTNNDDKEETVTLKKKSSEKLKLKSKRKLSLSDTTPIPSDKKRKLNNNDSSLNEFVGEPTIDHSVHFSNTMVLGSPITAGELKEAEFQINKVSDKKPVNVSKESNERPYSEMSGNNLGDLLNFVPSFSSPGKTNSSWDDACDSYLTTSLKHSRETPVQHDSNASNFGSHLMYSPKQISMPKNQGASLKSPPSVKRTGYNNSSVHSHPTLCHDEYSTPTKRRNSVHNAEASPLIQKVDSVISFNHMSPQRLNFSPVKMNSSVRKLERSPALQKLHLDNFSNKLSPQRLQFSPRKSESPRGKIEKANVSKHL